ncbi:S-layer homology domain-containing protein [Paenibacillus sepulcri]|uniref:S-layer homology domain-containing protein n=1 Tax=Paenibacillus sepulcri TaxID=359917 RepID=A0ABS7CBQ6_9BACL|nr:S-layer homology domain-containing protein [Paenibacillus sepulcri]
MGRKARRNGLMVVTVIGLSIMLYLVGAAAASAEAVFALDTDAGQVQPNGEFIVTVQAKDVQDVYGYELKLSYDGQKLEFVDVVQYMTDAGYKVPPVQEGNQVTIPFTKLRNVAGESGDVVIAKVKFKAKANTEGKAAIHLDRVKLGDSQLNALVWDAGTSIDVTITNSGSPGSPGSGNGSPGNPAVPTPRSEIPLEENDKTVEITEAQDGTQTVHVKVKPSILEAYLDELGRVPDGGKLVIDVESADALLLDIPVQAFQRYESGKTIISIRSGFASYDLPLHVLQTASLAGKLEADAGQMTLVIAIRKLNEAETGLLKSRLNAGMTLLGTPVEYRISVAANGKTIGISEFGQTFVNRSIIIPGLQDSVTATAFYTDTVNGRILFAPSQFAPRTDGKTEVVIKRNGNSVYGVVSYKQTFSDIQSHWAAGEIERLASKLIVKGDSGTLFSPNRTINRAEFAALLVRALGLKGEGEASFTDVNEDAWYAEPVQTGAEFGLIDGFEDGTFRPTQLVTREQMAVMASRAISLTGSPI